MKNLFSNLKNLKKEIENLRTINLNLNVSKNHNQFKKNNQRINFLNPIITKYEQYLEIENQIKKNNQAKLDQGLDPEFKKLINDENKELNLKLNQILKEIKVLLIPQNKDDKKNVIVEIRGAVGGEEANLFVQDLFKMYFKYCEKKNWKVKLIDVVESIQGGFSYISFLVSGKNVYENIKFEAGAHRVQRVPKTEAKGRVHTSVATVAVLPKVEAIELNINYKDLKIDTFHASGAGGQHVNTTDSAVRITHLPSNIVVSSQQERSQHENKEKALMVLRSKLLKFEQAKQQKNISDLRKSAIKKGQRSDKIRTYNFAQNRVTDHRINLTLKQLNQVLGGNLDLLITQLKEDHQLKMINLFFNDEK